MKEEVLNPHNLIRIIGNQLTVTISAENNKYQVYIFYLKKNCVLFLF